jgi:hypothetical protein
MGNAGEAFRRIRERGFLLIVGGDPDRQAVEHLVKPLTGRLHFPGSCLTR